MSAAAALFTDGVPQDSVLVPNFCVCVCVCVASENILFLSNASLLHLIPSLHSSEVIWSLYLI